jgi:hypothetical protein
MALSFSAGDLDALVRHLRGVPPRRVLLHGEKDVHLAQRGLHALATAESAAHIIDHKPVAQRFAGRGLEAKIGPLCRFRSGLRRGLEGRLRDGRDGREADAGQHAVLSIVTPDDGTRSGAPRSCGSCSTEHHTHLPGCHSCPRPSLVSPSLNSKLNSAAAPAGRTGCTPSGPGWSPNSNGWTPRSSGWAARSAPAGHGEVPLAGAPATP